MHTLPRRAAVWRRFVSAHSSSSAKRPPPLISLIMSLELFGKAATHLHTECEAGSVAALGVGRVLKSISEAQRLVTTIPTQKMPTEAMVSFLQGLVGRVQGVAVGETLLIPVNLAHPPMALAARVLRTALVDLLLSLAFILFVTYGFSGFFYMRLGPYISEYATDELSFIAMIRSIFGDFDLEGVMMMSSSFENVIFLMLYLIVIVFVLMSIFLTILGEYQSQVREEQAKEREAGEERVSLIVKAGRAALRAAERVGRAAERVGLGNWTVRITQGHEAAEEYKEESMRPKGAHGVSPAAERGAEGATILSVQAEVRECAARIDECANALRLLLEAAGVEDGVHLKLGASNGATPRGAPDGSRRRRRHRSSRETGPEASSSFV